MSNGYDRGARQWNDEVVKLCDRMIDIANRISRLKKVCAASVIQMWYRRRMRERAVDGLADIVLEIKHLPGIGSEFIKAEMSFMSNVVV